MTTCVPSRHAGSGIMDLDPTCRVSSWDDMTREHGRAQLERRRARPSENNELPLDLDLRYVKQYHEVTVHGLRSEMPSTPATSRAIAEAFHATTTGSTGTTSPRTGHRALDRAHQRAPVRGRGNGSKPEHPENGRLAPARTREAAFKSAIAVAYVPEDDRSSPTCPSYDGHKTLVWPAQRDRRDPRSSSEVEIRRSSSAPTFVARIDDQFWQLCAA